MTSPRVLLYLCIALATTLVAVVAGVLWSMHVGALNSARVVAAETEQVQQPIDIPLPTAAEVLHYGPRNPTIEPNFFVETRDALVAQKVSFIEANLTTMQIRLWENGTVALEVPIQTKGRPGSWWQTPAGVYSVATKNPKHFSSFGQVYTDWNLPFQGNFFIHGWPYHADGTPVPRGYSGGCIRLTDADARTLYEHADVGMPVLVYEEYFAADTFSYTPPEPEVSAPSYIVMDIKNNEVLAGRDTGGVYPVASITKLVTALVATEYVNLDKKITVSKTAQVETTKPRLVPGEQILAFHLLYPLLIESSNEAATALAESVGSKRYISLMNEKAQAIGMQSAGFVDATGSNADDRASASDVARLAQYLYYNRPFLLSLSASKLDPGLYTAPEFKDLTNYNLYSADTFFVGGKVGKTTAAAETMLAVFDIPVYGTMRPVAFVVLGSNDVRKDIDTLRSMVMREYQSFGTTTPVAVTR